MCRSGIYRTRARAASKRVQPARMREIEGRLGTAIVGGSSDRGGFALSYHGNDPQPLRAADVGTKLLCCTYAMDVFWRNAAVCISASAMGAVTKAAPQTVMVRASAAV